MSSAPVLFRQTLDIQTAGQLDAMIRHGKLLSIAGQSTHTSSERAAKLSILTPDAEAFIIEYMNLSQPEANRAIVQIHGGIKEAETATLTADYGSLIQDRCDGLIQDHLPPDRRVVTV